MLSLISLEGKEVELKKKSRSRRTLRHLREIVSEVGVARMTERRAKKRFPVVAPARYRLWDRKSEEIGTGQTVNVSSSGMLIRTNQILSLGERIEVAVDLLAFERSVDVELTVFGHVVRLEPDSAAIEFERYDLTRPSEHVRGSHSCRFVPGRRSPIRSDVIADVQDHPS